MSAPVLVLGVARVAVAERLGGPIALWPCGGRLALLSLPLAVGRGTRAAVLRRVAARADPFLPLTMPHRDPAGLARRIAAAPRVIADALAQCAGRLELGLAAEVALGGGAGRRIRFRPRLARRPRAARGAPPSP